LRVVSGKVPKRSCSGAGVIVTPSRDLPGAIFGKAGETCGTNGDPAADAP
jgi:hypothetical protein